MNLQGSPISKVWNHFRQQHPQSSSALVILHDEIQIPLGKVQVRRQNTSARGHNGLRSIDKAIGPKYTKIGIGIGKPNHSAIDRFVLSKFSLSELLTLSELSVPQVEAVIEEMLKGKYIYERA